MARRTLLPIPTRGPHRADLYADQVPHPVYGDRVVGGHTVLHQGGWRAAPESVVNVSPPNPRLYVPFMVAAPPPRIGDQAPAFRALQVASVFMAGSQPGWALRRNWLHSAPVEVGSEEP